MRRGGSQSLPKHSGHNSSNSLPDSAVRLGNKEALSLEMDDNLLEDTERQTSSTETSSSGRQVLLLTLFCGVGGFLFGYDTGNIAGALPYIRDELLTGYKANPNRLQWLEGLVVSAAVYGAALGSAGGGVFSDCFGRKAALKLADLFFIAGAIVMGVAPDCYVLITGRLIVGLGVGLASVTSPVFIAECAPLRFRAALVAFNVLMITTGQFLAFLLDYFFTFAPGTWRWMLGVACLPALVQMAGLMLLPESPRWLAGKGRLEEARLALSQLRPASQVEQELAETSRAVQQLKGFSSLQALHLPQVRLELFVGVGLQMMQQLCGINTVMYFTPTILRLAGITDNRKALLVALAPAAVNAAGTVLGMLSIDRWGRRKLLLTSLAGVVAALLCLGAAFKLSETHSPAILESSCPIPSLATCNDCIRRGCGFCSPAANERAPGLCLPAAATCPAEPKFILVQAGCPSPFLKLTVAGVVLYLAAFSPGLGTVPWSVNAEIYPVEVRGLANGASATANWVTNATVSQLFLVLAGLLGSSGVFWLLAFISVLGGLWTYIYLPETKGLTLEEIQELFVHRCGATRTAASENISADEAETL